MAAHFHIQDKCAKVVWKRDDTAGAKFMQWLYLDKTLCSQSREFENYTQYMWSSTKKQLSYMP